MMQYARAASVTGGMEREGLLMTVSAGYAEYPKDAGSFVDLYEYTDYALQYAKENGRDCLELFPRKCWHTDPENWISSDC